MRFFLLYIIVIFFNISAYSQENCNNGIDDDGDGKTDLNDSECVCNNSNLTSLITNYNFEQMNFCPDNWAEFSAATNWFQPNNGSSDYINSCGFIPASTAQANIYPAPTANGNGFSGVLFSQDYKEYIATCTNTILLAGTTYHLIFDVASSTSGRIVSTANNIGEVCNEGKLNFGTVNITLYGRSNCLPTSQNTNGNPTGWTQLGQAQYLPSKNWGQLSIIFTPNVNINSIMLGPPTTLPDSYIDEDDYRSCFPYFYFDNLVLNTYASNGLQINSTGIFCENTLTLHSNLNPALGNNFSFQWYKDGIAILGATNSQLNVNHNAANIGNYQVKVFNGNNCFISNKLNVNTVIDIPNYSINQSPCFPGTTTVTITTPADEYSFDNGSTWSTNPIKSNLTAYWNPIRIAIKKNGCISNTRYVILTYPPLNTIDQPQLSVVQPGCQTNGSITVLTPGLEYSYDDGVTWSTNSSLSNLPPNQNFTYKVRIKTLLGCITNARYVTMYPYSLPEPTYTKTNAGCGNGGVITITSPASEYSFDNGLTWSNNPTATNLNPGSYNIKIKNNLGCISYAVLVNISNTFITAPTVTFAHPTCENGGTIEILTPAAQYSFDNGLTWSTNPIATNLAPGYYYVKIKNSSNCVSYSNSVYLNTVQLRNPDYTLINPSCYDQNGTNITITINTPAAEYSFDNGVTWSTNNTATNLIGGIYYYLKIRNNLNCVSGTSIVRTLSQTASPNQPNITINHPTTCANGNGTINVTSPAFSYSFDNGSTFTNNPTSPQLPPGTYYIKIKESADGCPSNAAIAVINNPPDIPNQPTVTINHPISCANPFGTININSLASEYSFDNGMNYSSNSLSNPLSPGLYYVKIRNNSDCESQPLAVTINSPSDYPIAPNDIIVTQPNCTILTGTITINDIASQYSFDNGNTWNNSSTLSNLNPGIYNIKIKNSIGCSSNPTQIIIQHFTDFPNIPTLISPQSFCYNLNSAINDITITGQNIKWYDAPASGNLLASTTLLQNGVTYYASQTINGCESARVPVTVTIQNTQAPTGNAAQSFCSSQNATLNDVTVSGSNLIWYDSVTGTTVLPSTTLLANNTTYYATQTLNGCESTARFAVTVTLINTLNANNYSETLCDDLNNGAETVNLSNYNSDLIATTNGNTFSYYHSQNGAENQISADAISNFTNYNLPVGNNVIFVRIDSNNGCHQTVELHLTLVSKPVIPITDIMPMCEGSSITVNAGTGYDSYLWSTSETSPSITITTPGNYSVTVTENHGTVSCSTVKNFTVMNSNVATISEIVTSDWTNHQNTITVLLTGNSSGDYEYSLDGIHYQSSNTFTGLESGEYIVYVKDKNGCGVKSEDFYLLMYPNFFTPNGDGYNDYWKIELSEKEPNMMIRIFDRYGKLLKELGGNSQGWDGMCSGNMLPASDYWFVVKRQNGKEYRGHFSLKR